MQIIPYTPKSFAVVGETYHYKETLKAMGGAFSKWLKVDNKNVPGWCFSLKREVQVRKWMLEVSPAPTPKISTKAPATAGKPKAKGKASKPRKAIQADIQSLVAKEVARLMAKQAKAEIPAPTACSKERIQQALSGEAVSPRHWAMRHVLQNGLRPDDVSKGTGLFGRDHNGNAFGNSERRSMIWMLRSDAPAIDQALCEDCPEYFRNSVDADTLFSVVTEFSGPGGKSNLVNECCQLADGHAEAAVRSNDWFPY